MWDEGEESTEEKKKPGAHRTATVKTESADSLPDLVSDDTEEEDDGFMFLNTPLSTEEETSNDVEKEKKKQDMCKEIDSRDEEILMKELVEQILEMEDGISRKPIPLTGLTCPLTGEQYYIDP